MKLNVGKCTQNTWEYGRYWVDGQLLKKVPEGYRIRGEAYINGEELVAVCYKPARVVRNVVLATLLLAALVSLFFVLRGKFSKDDEVDELRTVDTGVTEESKDGLFGQSLVIRYNKFPANIDGSLDLRLVNGSDSATISIDAPGVTMEPVTLKPNEERYYVLVTIDSDEEIINGKLNYKSGDSSKSFDISIENLQDNKLNVPDEFVTFDDEEVLQ